MAPSECLQNFGSDAIDQRCLNLSHSKTYCYFTGTKTIRPPTDLLAKNPANE